MIKTDRITLLERELKEMNKRLIDLKKMVEQNYFYYNNHIEREHKKEKENEKS